MIRTSSATLALTGFWWAAAACAQAVDKLAPGIAPPLNGSVAQAAINDPQDDGLVEIAVTAQRRAQNLQAVPIAIAAVTADQLQASGVSDVTSLKLVTPGVEVQSNNGYAFPVIRGVVSKVASAGNERPIAVYVDGVYYYAPPRTYGVTAGVRF